MVQNITRAGLFRIASGPNWAVVGAVDDHVPVVLDDQVVVAEGGSVPLGIVAGIV